MYVCVYICICMYVMYVCIVFGSPRRDSQGGQPPGLTPDSSLRKRSSISGALCFSIFFTNITKTTKNEIQLKFNEYSIIEFPSCGS